MKLLDLITFIFDANLICIYGDDIPDIEGYPENTKFKQYYNRDIDVIISDNDIIAIKILPEQK